LPTPKASHLVKPADTAKYKRLTAADRALILQLAGQNKTQVQIAQLIGCTQSSISEWLSQCRDTGPEAIQYLRGQALPMAQDIVANGRPADKVSVLKGLSVLKDDAAQHITVLVGGPGQVNIGTELSPLPTLQQGEGEHKAQQKLAQSDNQSYVNHAKLLIDRE
jgi:hypothetical protein